MNDRPRSLYEKIWDAHVVERRDDGNCLIYIDRHLVHEVTSPQAFDGLRLAGRRVRRPDLPFATADHDVPTDEHGLHIADLLARPQIDTPERNCAECGVPYSGRPSPYQGRVHA